MSAERLVLAAGIAAALHVGKLAPALPFVQAALGLSLVEAGFLLSLVQLAGMCAGLAFGAAAGALGLRTSVLAGLLLLSAASIGGALADRAAALMAWRAAEGAGFLLVVLAAPALMRASVSPARLPHALGWWGAYMPLATALVLLVGAPWCNAFGWRSWWWLLASATLLAALAVWRGVAPVPGSGTRGWWIGVRQTLGARGPWLLAACFGCYSAQWLAVIGFLPTLAHEAGVHATTAGVLAAGVAAVNAIGNVAAGQLMARGQAAPRTLAAAFAVMAVAAGIAFLPSLAATGGSGAPSGGLAPLLRYGALLVFSMVGGLIPGTLFALAPRLAPEARVLATTVGWMQQGSALGQFAGPPAVAWLAAGMGDWSRTAWVTGACALGGMLLSAWIARALTERAPQR